MGFKTKNYEAKAMGITLPEAYAIIKGMLIVGNDAVATFAIQCTRDNALGKPPIEIKKMNFTVDRNENSFVTAYNLAKAEGGIFAGWEDDIITG